MMLFFLFCFWRNRLSGSHDRHLNTPTSLVRCYCCCCCSRYGNSPRQSKTTQKMQREAAEGQSKNESESKKRVAENESSADTAEACYRAEAHVRVSVFFYGTKAVACLVSYSRPKSQAEEWLTLDIVHPVPRICFCSWCCTLVSANEE